MEGGSKQICRPILELCLERACYYPKFQYLLTSVWRPPHGLCIRWLISSQKANFFPSCLVTMGSLFNMFFVDVVCSFALLFLEFVLEWMQRTVAQNRQSWSFSISHQLLPAGHLEVLLTYMALSEPQARLLLA